MRKTTTRHLQCDDAEIYTDRNDMFVTTERLTTVISCHACHMSYENAHSEVNSLKRASYATTTASANNCVNRIIGDEKFASHVLQGHDFQIIIRGCKT